MKEIVKLDVRGTVSVSLCGTMTLNGNDFGKTLGLMLGGKYIENAVVNITICDAGQEEKGAESDETV